VQVAAAFLDAHNLPCNFLPPTQEPAGWNVLRNMLIDLINEDRVSVVGVAPGAGGPGKETSWLARCTAMTSFEVTAEEMMMMSFICSFRNSNDCRQGDWIVEVAHRPSTQD
jgi:hypothetical protein